MDSIFGSTTTEIGNGATSFGALWNDKYSEFGSRIWITAKDLEFGYGVGEDLNWLRYSGPSGYYTSYNFPRNQGSKFRFEI